MAALSANSIPKFVDAQSFEFANACNCKAMLFQGCCSSFILIQNLQVQVPPCLPPAAFGSCASPGCSVSSSPATWAWHESLTLSRTQSVGKAEDGRSVLKRPAAMKSSGWKKTSYTRSKSIAETRMDRISWKRALPELLRGTDNDLIYKLRQDRLLPRWEGHVCPRCEKGTLSALKPHPSSGSLKHRCSQRGCNAYISPHHLHPLFVDGRGSGCLPLSTQSALLLLLLNNISHPAIHRLLDVNHKVIEDWDNRLSDLRMKWVEEKEKDIVFGAGKPWSDVEADEATFDRKTLKDAGRNPSACVEWEQWWGIVKRGHPETLVLHRLKPTLSADRAPGPGAIRKTEWKPLAKTWLENQKVILHTDAAKSYRLKVDGVVHDNVIHCKKRIKVKGKWRWQLPKYVRLITHRLPGTTKTLKVKAGTQVIDRAWRYLKDRLTINQHCRAGSKRLRSKLRSAQYQYWLRQKDLWMATGDLCAWEMKNFLHRAT